MTNFASVPVRFEAFATFGHALCADLFLFHFTLLPLRCALSLLVAMVAIARWIIASVAGLAGYIAPGSNFASSVAYRCAFVERSIKRHARGLGLPLSLGRAHVYDLLKGSILLLATLTLGYLQVSRVYHYIRGEAVIKLYVVYNVLSMGDALLCSLGQDIMDALYRTTRDALGDDDAPGDAQQEGAGGTQSGHGVAGKSNVSFAKRGFSSYLSSAVAAITGSPTASTALLLCAQLAAAVAYVSAHACVIFIQIVCLNVAMNSKNNALLTLLVSNNFVELKGSVFKKYEPENLFQVACADAVERFTLSLFLVLIGLTELVSLPTLAALLPSIGVIWAAELGVDYAKHAFVAKFNCLSSDLYASFAAILAHDALAVRGRMATSLDPTHAPARRLGLAALPLSCVVIRMAMAKVPVAWRPRIDSPSGLLVWLLLACVLLATKLLLNMGLLLHSAGVVRAQQAKLTATLHTDGNSRASADEHQHVGLALHREARSTTHSRSSEVVGALEEAVQHARARPQLLTPPTARGAVSSIALVGGVHVGGLPLTSAHQAAPSDHLPVNPAASDEVAFEEDAAMLERVSRTERYTMRGKAIPFG